MYNISDNGFEFLIRGEGKPGFKAWFDELGYAIGYGCHVFESGKAVKPGDTIESVERARNILRYYVNTFCIPPINKFFGGANLEQHKVDALISFIANCGSARLTSTGLAKTIKINKEDPKIRQQFMSINKGHTTGVSLVGRRQTEIDLYFNADYNNKHSKRFIALSNNTKSSSGNDFENKSLKNYCIRYCNDKTIVTLQDFINYWQLNMTPKELMSFENNEYEIFRNYKADTRKKYNNKASVDFLEYGTSLKVPNTSTGSKSIFNLHQTLFKNNNYDSFIETSIKKLLYNDKYKKINIGLGENEDGVTYKRFETLSVYVWSRSVNNDESTVLDITGTLIGVEINVGANGGSFSLTLPKITYQRVGDKFYPNTDIFTGNGNSEFVTKQNTHKKERVKTSDFAAKFTDDNEVLSGNPEIFRRTNNYYSDLIQKNDIVFIRFERLQTEQSSDLASGFVTDKDSAIKIVDSKVLSEKTYDMIGFVDLIPLNTTGEGGVNVNVTVSGKDFMKLLIDDAVYFFLSAYNLQNINQTMKGGDLTSDGQRFVVKPDPQSDFDKNISLTPTGIANFLQDENFNFFEPHTVEDVLVFLFSKLIHLRILKTDNLFKSYKDKSFIISSDSNKDEGGDVTLNYKRVLAKGVWQIVKLVIDKNIGTRKLFDYSLTTDTGSLINFVRKVAQKPFVEFFGDTYNDKYYYIFRKPPFSEQSYKTNFCINIFEEDIQGSETLEFSDEIYSWYKLTPIKSIIKDESLLMLDLPAVLIPEYLEIWGNKVLSIDSNYIDFDITESQFSGDDTNFIKKQHREDLDWLIETNCYLPFTRKGNLKLKGDRRIKKGMNIRHMGTGEIFYVEAVANKVNFTEHGVERETIIEVSHGIVEKYYDFYFNIINLYRRAGESEHTWKVNKEVFDFFLQRKQFSGFNLKLG